MTRGEEIIIQSYDYDKYLLDTGFSTEEAALKCMRVAFIDGARWADSHPRWISVEDELPPRNILVITCDGQENINLLMLGGNGRWYDKAVGLHRNITHWMPLPQAPTCSEKPNNPKKGGEE